jgi:hypothetical protein
MVTKLLNLKHLFLILIFAFVFALSLSSQTALPDKSVKVYPTEVRNDHFFVELTDFTSLKVSFKMTNLIGNEVEIESIDLSGGKYRINIPYKLAAGIYLIRINTLEGQIIKKIIVRT